jgi:hypothetical protein
MRDPRLRPFRGPVLAFALMLSVQAVSAAVLYAGKIGFSSERVKAFYLGSEAEYTRPRTLAGLLEVAVPHLLAIPTVLLVTLHLIGLTGLLRPRLFGILSRAAFGSALAGVAAGFATRFWWAGVAWAKIASFAAFEALLVLWFVLLVSLFVPPPSAPRVAAARGERSGGGRAPADPVRERA